MKHPDPKWERFEAAITRDRLPDRLPVAEIEVDFSIMAAFLGRPISDMATYVSFWKEAGYDYAPLQVRGQPLADSFQIKIAEGILEQPGPQSASTFASAISDDRGFDSYPWIGPADVYYKDLDLIETVLPDEMKVIVNVGPIFSGAWRCMGLESFSIACTENPPLVEAVVDKTGSLLLAIAQNALERPYVGGIWLGDDFAYTTGLMVSPAFLRQHIFPFYARVGDLCRRQGKLFIFHSDGKLTDVFDDLLACGIQAVHPNEPTSVDIVQLKQRWGDRVSFIGNVDVDLLARGSLQDVAEAVMFLIENVAPGGGFALGSGNSVADYVPLPNFRMLLDTVRRHGNIY
jgi:uroporphyrinogen decarboxylase